MSKSVLRTLAWTRNVTKSVVMPTAMVTGMAGVAMPAEPIPSQQEQIDFNQCNMEQLARLYNYYSGDMREAVWNELADRCSHMQLEDLQTCMASNAFPVRQAANEELEKRVVKEVQSTGKVPAWLAYNGDDGEVGFRMRKATETAETEIAFLGAKYTPPPERKGSTNRTVLDELSDLSLKTGRPIMTSRLPGNTESQCVTGTDARNHEQTYWEFVRHIQTVDGTRLGIYRNSTGASSFMNEPSVRPYYTGSNGAVVTDIYPSMCGKIYMSDTMLEPGLYLESWENKSAIAKRADGTTFKIPIENSRGTSNSGLNLQMDMPDKEDETEEVDITLVMRITGYHCEQRIVNAEEEFTCKTHNRELSYLGVSEPTDANDTYKVAAVVSKHDKCNDIKWTAFDENGKLMLRDKTISKTDETTGQKQTGYSYKTKPRTVMCTMMSDRHFDREVEVTVKGVKIKKIAAQKKK